MPSSKTIVFVIVGLAVVVVAGLWLYVDERGAQAKLAAVDCVTMLPTTFELQGRNVDVSREKTCEVVRLLAEMPPVGDAGDAADPWHYFGRMRIRPKDDVWFLIFVARRSDAFHPMLSLRHRRANGWAVIGVFDAVPVLRMLGLEDRIDMEKLAAPAARIPVDQMSPM